MGHCLFLRKGEVHTVPVTGVLASSLAVGSTVKLMEGGTAVEYLVVNQGIPENSNLYDASCDGTWLLRKDCYDTHNWNDRASNVYQTSLVNTFLNTDFLSLLGESQQAIIKEVKIPYTVGAGSSSIMGGEQGLPVKVFLLCSEEIGMAAVSTIPADGAKLSYFESGTGQSAKNKRIANYNGSAINCWLRSPHTGGSITDMRLAWYITTSGILNSAVVTNSYGIRPALVLPSNALFDKTTMLLKGVK